MDGQVLPSQWYPYESFRRIAFASFKVIGKGNLDAAHAFGKFTMQNLLEIYQNLIITGDPVASVNKLARLRRTFFETEGEGDTEMTGHGTDWLIYQIISPPQEEDMERFEVFCHSIAGNLEELVEQSGGSNVKVAVDIKKDICDIRVEWE